MARSSVLFPAPEGPTTAVMSSFGTSTSTPFRISTPPVAYLRPEILIPRESMLEHLPAQVGVEPIEDGVGVAGLGRGEGRAHGLNSVTPKSRLPSSSFKKKNSIRYDASHA